MQEDISKKDISRIISQEFSELPLTDSHCHLSLLHQHDQSIVPLLLDGPEDLVVLDVGLRPKDWTARKAFLGDNPHVYHSVGLHPGYYQEYTPQQLIEELELFTPHAIAIGETGLDWVRMSTPRHKQQEMFDIHIALAKAQKKPLIIHARDSIDDVLDMVSEAGIHPSHSVGIMHCFSGTKAQAKRSLDLGMYISFAANISYNSAQDLREVAAYVPSNLFLLETDAPYLLHKEVQKIFSRKTYKQNKRYHRINLPLYLHFLYRTIAEIRSVHPSQIAREVRDNFLSCIQGNSTIHR